MNKKVAVAIAVVIAILLVLWFLMGRKADDAGQGMMERASDQQTAAEEPSEAGMTDWMKAIAGGQKLSCTYTMGTGADATTVKMYVDGKKYRSEMMAGGTQMMALSDGQTIYTWTPATKQGFKMDLSCLEDVKSTAPQGTAQPDYKASAEEALQDMPDVACEPAGAVDLSLPSDITFTDQCAMMKNVGEMMQQYQGQMPAGVTLPAMPSGN